MKYALYICVLTLTLASCKAQEANELTLSEETPECIKTKIAEIVAGDVWNPPAKIYSYTYDRQTVYFVSSRCCDIPSIVYNDKCEAICSPDGGFTGRGDGKCTDFYESRSNEQLIWKDTRE